MIKRMDLPPDVTVMITDESEFFETAKNSGFCIISIRAGYEGADAYVESWADVEELSDEFLRRLYDHHVGRPYVVAQLEEASGHMVTLREFTQDDWPAYRQIMWEGREGVRDLERLFPDGWTETTSEEEARRFGEGMARNYRMLDMGLWLITWDEEPAGLCGLEVSERGVELSYMVRPAYQNRGLATEMSRRVIDYAREEVGMTELQLFCDKKNQRSRRIAETLGFICQEEISEAGGTILKFVKVL